MKLRVVKIVICVAYWFTIVRSDCTNGDIRLRNGCSETEGRVEICDDNTWGTVCHDQWSNNDARVACRQLGFSTSGAVRRIGAYFGRGCGPIVLNNLDCTGGESRLVDCPHNGLGVHNCGHNKDAGVTCQPAECEDDDLRLEGGHSLLEGRVEICQSNGWETICDNNWTTSDANVVCRQLGFPDIGAIPVGASDFFAQENSQNHNKHFNCFGNEDNLAACHTADSHCDHTLDVGVFCSVSLGSLQLTPQADKITMIWQVSTSREILYYEAFCNTSSTNYAYLIRVEASNFDDNNRITYYGLQPETGYQCCVTAYYNYNIIAIPSICNRTLTTVTIQLGPSSSISTTTTTEWIETTDITDETDDQTQSPPPEFNSVMGECSGVGAGLGVLVAVLVVLLVLTTGGCIYLLLRRNRGKDGNPTARYNTYTSGTTPPQQCSRNPAYTSHEPPTSQPPAQESEQTGGAQYSSLGPTYAVLEPPASAVKQEGGGGGEMAATYEVPMNLQQESADYSVLEPEAVNEAYSSVQHCGHDDYSQLQH